MEVVQLADPAEFLERAGPLLLADEARAQPDPRHRRHAAATSPQVYREHELVARRGRGRAWSALRCGRRRTTSSLARAEQRRRRRGARARVRRIAAGRAAERVPEAEEFARACGRRAGVEPRGPRTQADLRGSSSWCRRRPTTGGRATGGRRGDRALAPRLVARVRRSRRSARRSRTQRSARSSCSTTGSVVRRDRVRALGGRRAPVSLAGFGGSTPNGSGSGLSTRRRSCGGRGYASALTAAVSAEPPRCGHAILLPLHRPRRTRRRTRSTSTIGYERVCDSIEYAFV